MSEIGDALAGLTAAPVPPTPERRTTSAPKGWEAGVCYDPSGAMTVTTTAADNVHGDPEAWHRLIGDLGLTVPDGWRVRLVEAKYDPAAWHRDAEGEDAVTRPVWRYRFAVEPGKPAVDIDELLARVKRAKAQAVRPTGESAYVVALGDVQAGKMDGDGTAGTVDRVVASIDAQAARLKELRRMGRSVGTVYLTWLGDCVEGFVSQGGSNAWRTPMTLTEQVRVVRRLMLHQVETFRSLSERIVLCSIPGNHDEAVRFGKGGVTRYDDSWAVEAAVQVGDALALNPAAYGHVSVAVPGRDELTLTLDMAGTRVGLAHGHQFRKSPMSWWAEQAHGMQPVGESTLLLAAHLHHLRVEQSGAKTFIQVPSPESESTWWKHLHGQVSPPGTVTLLVGGGGWSDLAVV